MEEKPRVEFDSQSESGNIFAVMALAHRALMAQKRIDDFDEMRKAVLASKSYEAALARIREYVDLVDVRGAY